MNKELFVTSTPHETKVALTEDDQLAEIYLERENEYILAGSVYKGRVTRVLPGMQSAFVDIGLERDAFLYVSDFFEMEEEDEDLEAAVAKARPIIQGSSSGSSSAAPASSNEISEVEEEFEEEGDFSEEADVEDDASLEVVEEVEAAETATTGNESGSREVRGRRRRGRRGRSSADATPARTESEADNGPSEQRAAAHPSHLSPVAVATAPPNSYQPIVMPGESLSKYRKASVPVETAVVAAVVAEVPQAAEPPATPVEMKVEEPMAVTPSEETLVIPIAKARRKAPAAYTPMVMPGETLAKYRRVRPEGQEQPAPAEPIPAPEPVHVAEPEAAAIPETSHAAPEPDAAAPSAGHEEALAEVVPAEVEAASEPVHPSHEPAVAEENTPKLTEDHALDPVTHYSDPETMVRRSYEAPQVEVHAGVPEGNVAESVTTIPVEGVTQESSTEAPLEVVHEVPSREPELTSHEATQSSAAKASKSRVTEPESETEIESGVAGSEPITQHASDAHSYSPQWIFHEQTPHPESGSAEAGHTGHFEDDEDDEPHFSELVSALPADVSVTDFVEQRAEAEREEARILPGGNMTEEEIDEEEAELRAYGADVEDIGFDEFEEETQEADGFIRGVKADTFGDDDDDFEGEDEEGDEEEGDEEEGDEADEAQDEAERLAAGGYESSSAEVRAPSGARFQQRARRSGQRTDRNDRGDRGGQRRSGPGRSPGRNSGAPRRFSGRRDMGPRPQIADLLKEGQEIIVQIAKEPIAKKGARITSHIALPGRFLVYMPTVNHVGVSRKIASDEERLRLKRIVVSERENGTGGFIVRTAAQNAPEEELRADIRFLKNLWHEMKQRAETKKPPALIYHDLNVVERVLRDQVTRDFTTIWVDTEVEYERILRFAQRFQPSLVKRIKLWSKNTPLFDQFGVTDEFNKALKAKVWLKNGGYIVINQTEALVAIDVNTGKYVGKTARLEDTITKTNVEACAEIVRQIRLRDLGGIIILDFIDMDERRNRAKVMQALEEAMKNDRAPSKILQFNDFGLVAITRKRVKQSLERTVGSSCEYCVGTGYVKSVTTVCNEIYVEMRKIAHQLTRSDVMLRVHPEVGKMLKSNNGRWIQELEELTSKTVIVKGDPLVHQEQFDIN